MRWPRGDDSQRESAREFQRSRLDSFGSDLSGWIRWNYDALGTTNLLLLRSDDRDRGLAAAEHARELTALLERRFSKFDPESELSLVNQLAGDRPVRVGTELFELLQCSRLAWEASGGAFDPTVGSLLSAWGFVDLVPRVVSPEEVEASLARVGMDVVELDPIERTVRFLRPGLSLDLGGVGKGSIADRIAARLRADGIEAGAVSLGRSTIVVWGSAPDGGNWRISVEHPNGEAAGPPLLLDVDPGAVSSSGVSERRLRVAGDDIGHIFDPRSGKPARSVASATIWTPTACVGDVLSTSLFVLGPASTPSGEALERICRTLAPGDPRASLLWFEDDPTRWGGVRERVSHLGQPGFRFVP
jgi:thiamine biosynthesis lipoprotein ApbE